MRVYILEADSNHYQNLILPNESDWETLHGAFDGIPLGDSWTPLPVAVLRDQDHRGRPAGDYPSLAGNIAVFSPRALDALGDLLEGNGEVLPLSCPDGEYVAFNVTRVVDALDVERSDVRRFKSSGRIRDIERFEFRPELLGGLSIFKLPEIPDMRIFVTERFVQRVQQAGLAGFLFQLAWADTAGTDL